MSRPGPFLETAGRLVRFTNPLRFRNAFFAPTNRFSGHTCEGCGDHLHRVPAACIQGVTRGPGGTLFPRIRPLPYALPAALLCARSERST
jgi:hypothetical protein